jgi:hypothetical protein
MWSEQNPRVWNPGLHWYRPLNFTDDDLMWTRLIHGHVNTHDFYISYTNVLIHTSKTRVTDFSHLVKDSVCISITW